MLKMILTNKAAISFQEIAALLVVMDKLNNVFIFKASPSTYVKRVLNCRLLCK
jgi:hypothetical protein